MKTTILSPSARLDLLEIDLRTIELFGYDQSAFTAEEFRRVFRMLAENPELGQIRKDVSPAGKSFGFGLSYGVLLSSMKTRLRL